VPDDWELAVAGLAAVFHFQPSELWQMTVEDLAFWVKQAIRMKGG
jgi:hypothetical protein